MGCNCAKKKPPAGYRSPTAEQERLQAIVRAASSTAPTTTPSGTTANSGTTSDQESAQRA